jgi:hypothetical protein
MVIHFEETGQCPNRLTVIKNGVEEQVPLGVWNAGMRQGRDEAERPHIPTRRKNARRPKHVGRRDNCSNLFELNFVDTSDRTDLIVGDIRSRYFLKAIAKNFCISFQDSLSAFLLYAIGRLNFLPSLVASGLVKLWNASGYTMTV